MTILQDIVAAAGWQTRVTENFRTVNPAGLYGIDPATTSGLTFGYLGGQFNGQVIANGTVALTASATNYLVAHRTTGIVTASTGTTNWLNTATYMQLHDFVAGGSTFTIAASSDKRQAFGGSGSGGSALTSFTESVTVAAPNATVPVVQFLATNAATNVDVALSPKGTGAIVAHVADNLTAGGNKRGARAVDWQTDRGANTQVASGANSVLGGGFDSVASGAHSVVAGGYSNASSNASSTVSGGRANTASGNYSTVAGGQTNTASTGNGSTVGGGQNNTATGTDAVVPGGTSNLADGDGSVALGNRSSARLMMGAISHASAPNPTFTVGARQRRWATLQVDSTDAATTKVLTTDGNAAGANNQYKLVSGSGLKVKGQVIVRNATDGDCGAFDVSGMCRNVGGTVSLSGTPVISAYMGDASLNTCVVAIVADNTNKTLQLTCNGVAATSLIWAAETTSVEITA